MSQRVFFLDPGSRVVRESYKTAAQIVRNLGTLMANGSVIK